MKTRVPAVLLLALAGALLAPAQPKKRPTAASPAPTPKAYPIESLRVEGNREIPADRISAASGLKIGQSAQKADFDAARGRLLNTGAFEDVGYEYRPSADNKGYDAVLKVTEVTPLFPFRFEDLKAPEDRLRAAIQAQEPLFSSRIPANQTALERCAAALGKMLGTPVEGKLTPDAKGDVAIVFSPAGARPNIAEVRFQGNDALPSELLMRRISEVAIGIPYTEAAMRQRLDAAIRPLYEARGRLRVSFPAIATKKAPGVDGVDVLVTVSEGPSYTLGNVSFTGIAPDDVRRAARLVDWKKGDIANFDDINTGLDKIRKNFRSRGYLHVDSNVTRTIRDSGHIVNLAIAVDTGPQYRFGKLTIQGLDILSEPEIRKAWELKEGAPFQPDYPDAFLASLRAQGVFENLGKTRSETRVNEASKTVDVTLYFSGADRKNGGPGRDPQPFSQSVPQLLGWYPEA